METVSDSLRQLRVLHTEVINPVIEKCKALRKECKEECEALMERVQNSMEKYAELEANVLEILAQSECTIDGAYKVRETKSKGKLLPSDELGEKLTATGKFRAEDVEDILKLCSSRKDVRVKKKIVVVDRD
jgi:hypothetical protein